MTGTLASRSAPLFIMHLEATGDNEQAARPIRSLQVRERTSGDGVLVPVGARSRVPIG
jgi:hypothetical protein